MGSTNNDYPTRREMLTAVFVALGISAVGIALRYQDNGVSNRSSSYEPKYVSLIKADYIDAANHCVESPRNKGAIADDIKDFGYSCDDAVEIVKEMHSTTQPTQYDMWIKAAGSSFKSTVPSRNNLACREIAYRTVATC